MGSSSPNRVENKKSLSCHHQPAILLRPEEVPAKGRGISISSLDTAAPDACIEEVTMHMECYIGSSL